MILSVEDINDLVKRENGTANRVSSSGCEIDILQEKLHEQQPSREL